MRKVKRALFFVLVLFSTTIMVLVASADSVTIIDNGVWFNNISWKLDNKGTLTIEGEGEMYDGVSSFPDWTEDHGYEIQNIIISEGITSICHHAFSGLSNLKSVSLPNSLLSIGWDAFYSCNQLDSVYLPNSIQIIESGAFSDCCSLLVINLPESLDSIGNGAFYNCTALTNVTFPDSVIEVPDSIFYGCSNLTSVKLSQYIKSIGANAFYRCENLYDLVLPDTLIDIGSNAFYGIPAYNDVSNWDNGVLYLNNYLISAQNSISGCYKIRPGTRVISDSAFEESSLLEGVVLPDSLITIGDNAFRMSTIEQIVIPEGVESIGISAFEFCNQLKTVVIPDSVTELKTMTFSNCALLENVVLSDNLTSIGAYAFDQTPFYEDTFTGDAVSWPDGVLYIDNYLIEANNLIANDYTIKDGTLGIADDAFLGNLSIKSITIPDSVQFIGREAFYNTDLQIINGLNGFKTIGESSFYHCSIKVLSIPDSVVRIDDNAFSDCELLTNITMPNGIDVIHTATFKGCKSLKSLLIPDGVRIIDYDAFGDCISLKSVCIPTSVTIINPAFYGNEVLSDVYYSGSQEQWEQIEISEWNSSLLAAKVHFAIESHTHIPITHTQPSTCIVQGYTITTCLECGDQLGFEVLPFADHRYGEWVTVNEPTTTEKGRRERICTVCGVAKETEDIPMLEQLVAKDEPSGITVSFDEGTYEEDAVELRVEEVFDGSQYLTQSYGRIDTWNIKTYINGEEAQPGQPVTVRIPQPEGYDPNNIAVFHVNSKTGQSERIEDVRVEDGYIVFTATSFSVYIVVDESSAVQADPEPDPNLCPWCGKVHSGFFGGLIAFFHRIFARLFGAKF